MRVLTEGESVTLSAVVTDPDGVADIAAGQVELEDGAVLGAFTGSGGAFTFPLSWDQLDGARAIDFESTDARALTARFFDAGGLDATATVTLTLTCDGLEACDGACGFGRCDGTCVDLQEDNRNCGRCGRSCDDGCTQGMCAAWSDCLRLSSGNPYFNNTAADICTALGGTCIDDGDIVHQAWEDSACQDYRRESNNCRTALTYDSGKVRCFLP
jgi:hypothetical protein